MYATFHKKRLFNTMAPFNDAVEKLQIPFGYKIFQAPCIYLKKWFNSPLGLSFFLIKLKVFRELLNEFESGFR